MRCLHRFLQIEEFNALGQVVSCCVCGKTFQLSDEGSASDFYPFTYHVPGKGDKDVYLLVHHSAVRVGKE